MLASVIKRFLAWFRTPLRAVTAAIVVLAGVFGLGTITGGVLLQDVAVLEKAHNRIDVLLHPEAVSPADNWREAKGDAFTLEYQTLETELDTLEKLVVPIGKFTSPGGAMAAVGDHILFATTKGSLGYAKNIGTQDAVSLTYLDDLVPMRMDVFEESAFARTPMVIRANFRTLDLLVRPLGEGRYDLFVSHHRFDDECVSFVISQQTLVERDGGLSLQGDWQEVFVATPCIEAKTVGNVFGGLRDGGRMVFKDENTLLVSIGDHDFDGDNAPLRSSQRADFDHGKIIELDLETGDYSHFAIGMRNPQGLVITEDGTIFQTEHGPQGGDEVNVIRQGENYGWPEVTLGTAYGFPRRDWPNSASQGRHDGYVKPVHAFVPSIGITNIVEVAGPEFPLWRGDLLLTSLRDNSIYRLRRNGDEIIYSERIEMGEHLRDIAWLPDGRVAFLGDSGHIMILRKKPPLSGAAASEASTGVLVSGYDGVRDAVERIEARMVRSDIHPGQTLYEGHCASCHSLESQAANVGPHLDKVVGRQIASVAGYDYSDALTSRSGKWTEARLRQFLSNPDLEFSGTAMPHIKLTKVEYLHLSWYLTNCTSGNDRPECHRAEG